MIRHLAAAGIAAITLLAAAPAPQSTMTLTVKLSEQNKSGETGVATLTDTADGLMVVLKLDGAPAGVPQPAHIHKGTCEKLDPKPAYPLSSAIDGKSTTEKIKGMAAADSTVPAPAVTIADLLKAPYAINVHKSTTEAMVYVSCGNIVKAK
jgi:hypothetical protein